MNQRDPNQWDDLVRRKLAERSHQPPPGAWEAAERLIEADRSRKKRGVWLLLLGLLLLVGGVWGWTGWPLPGSIGPAATQAPTALAGTAQDANASRFPVIEGTPCPPEVPQGPSAASAGNASHSPWVMPSSTSRTRKQTGALPDTPWAGSSLSPTAAAKAAETSQTPPDVPEGAEYGGLGSIYALARRDVKLPWSLVAPSVERIPGWQPDLDPRRWGLHAELGMSLSQSWQNTRAAAPRLTQAPLLGVGLSRDLRPGWRIQLGLRYQNRGGLNSDSTYLRQELAFGRRDTFTNIDPRRLHFLGLPVRLDVRLQGRHYLQAGVQPNVLINASGRLTETASDVAGTTVLDQRRTWGYRQGFAPWDVQLLMGYRYYLGRGLRVGLSGSYGLRDLTEPGFFRNDRDHRAWNLRIMLTYNLARF